MTHRPILIFGYGNPSRGDDALGPEFLERLEQARLEDKISAPFDTLTDFQLQIEHALDLQDRSLVLFVDASASSTAPFSFTRIRPIADESYTTHAMSPAAVLAVFEKINHAPPPPAFMLSISGFEFDLGKPISKAAGSNLEQALAFTEGLLETAQFEYWMECADEAIATSCQSKTDLQRPRGNKGI